MGVTDRLPRRSRRNAEGPTIGTALLGVVCAAGVLGVLTLLYHFG
jgi:hypothetical protein